MKKNEESKKNFEERQRDRLPGFDNHWVSRKRLSFETLIIISISIAALIQQTQATFITGNIDFSSIPGGTVGLLGGGTFQLSTGLDFPIGPNAQVDGASGSFASELGQTATFNDF